ncbi:MAG: hypothetical protein MJZ79_05070 [Paludibacteraceae bacterium]|nr:hypothetical protein [Candidatus Faecinaster equi]MCQ2078182.1 hypothetical protein [Bacteroidaceae bacterium]MCQ2340135.1 hypothetical protein [Paludibacteraceae bacterium]
MTRDLTHSEIAEILIENILTELTQYLITDYGYTLEQSLDCVYSSKLLSLLQQEDDELYVQSPAYLYELLKQELPQAA